MCQARMHLRVANAPSLVGKTLVLYCCGEVYISFGEGFDPKTPWLKESSPTILHRGSGQL